MGKSGRTAVAKHLPQLIKDHNCDMVIANGENAAHGFGLTSGIAKQLHDCGIDVITGGNHTFDQKEFVTDIDKCPQVIRPCNFPPNTPGLGSTIHHIGARKILVVNVMGRLFMDPLDCPFRSIDKEIQSYHLGINIHGIIVDIHAEASSEKQAIAAYLDGRASLVVGTHTHVPTADTRILPNGTGYQTDAGMCGDYDSIIGMKKELALPKMITKLKGERLQPADDAGSVFGVAVTINAQGLASNIKAIKAGWPH